MPVVPYAEGKTSVSIRLRYLTMSPEAQWAPSQERVIVATYSRERTQGYFVPHFRLSGRFPAQSEIVAWQAGIENVFDRKWRSPFDWENFTTHSPLYRPGRTFYLGLTIGN